MGRTADERARRDGIGDDAFRRYLGGVFRGPKI
jgi:hypothetical protein